MALRLLNTVLPTKTTENGIMAKVYRDNEWSEYRVKFYRLGQHIAGADYHTDDHSDALATAWSTVEQLNVPSDVVAGDLPAY